MNRTFDRSLVGAKAALVIAATTCMPLQPARSTEVFGRDFELNSVATSGADWIQLTSADLRFDAASAFLKMPIALDTTADLSVAFSFEIRGGTGGSDGFTDDEAEPLGQPGGHAVPHGVGLRVAVQQQQRRATAADAGEHGAMPGVDGLGAEAWEQVVGVGHRCFASAGGRGAGPVYPAPAARRARATSRLPSR